MMIRKRMRALCLLVAAGVALGGVTAPVTAKASIFNVWSGLKKIDRAVNSKDRERDKLRKKIKKARDEVEEQFGELEDHERNTKDRDWRDFVRAREELLKYCADAAVMGMNDLDDCQNIPK